MMMLVWYAYSYGEVLGEVFSLDGSGQLHLRERLTVFLFANRGVL
jgi:hypothetical protein